jgi:CRISPR-associated protein Cas4
LPSPEDSPEDKIHATSVSLASVKLGVSAKVDLVEAEGGVAVPVDYKRGKRPHVARGAYEPERVQLCVQGLLLEEAGYVVTHGILYFAGSRERVRVEFDSELRQSTLEAIASLRGLRETDVAPPPLVDSPKCPRCSLVGICLPDEVSVLQGEAGLAPRH